MSGTKCRSPSCNEKGQYEGYCGYCVSRVWKQCKENCDQYTMSESGRCYYHRSGAGILTVREVSRMLGVSDKTVQRMEDLPHTRTAGGHRRYKREDVEKYVQEVNQWNSSESST